VLVTTFRTASGECRLRDAMPVFSEEEKARTLHADHEMLRELEGVRGEVELRIEYAPRPKYGQSPTPRVAHVAQGIRMDLGGAVLLLRTDAPVEWSSSEAGLHSRLVVREGERYYFSLSFAEDAPAVLPLLGEYARARLDGSVAWWREWAGRCRYAGPHRDAVVRSALTVKLLTYAPSGAIVAAATTSLPEWPGSTHNYDYRYCWLRDAALTASALLELGYREEAEALLGWMLHATRLTQPELQIVYSVTGEARLPERELDHWAGYMESVPVRVGNDAYRQLQLDVYGEVVAAAALVHRAGESFDRDTRRLLRGIGETVANRWREPDEGIWEPRGGRQHHTHSKVLCWVALDRLIAFHEAGVLDIDVERYRRERDAIRAEVEAQGYNESLQSYVSVLDGDELDASLLVLPLYGYVAGDDPRMRGTVRRIREELGTGSLLRRYRAPDDDPQGAFGICSFWAADCLARAGDLDAASTVFEDLLT
jgi:GH15 family glucan-1,4-alpha-glucosidase